MAAKRVEDYNPFGQRLNRLFEERGVKQGEVSRRMHERGWPPKNPQQALSHAMLKKSTNVNLTTVYYVSKVLELTDDEERRLMWAAYEAERDMLEDSSRPLEQASMDRTISASHVSR
jgi:hypothetical protein